jgi:hypothetical protein
MRMDEVRNIVPIIRTNNAMVIRRGILNGMPFFMDVVMK